MGRVSKRRIGSRTACNASDLHRQQFRFSVVPRAALRRIILSIVAIWLLDPAGAEGQENRGQFSAIAATATRVEHVLSLVEPFFDQCNYESEFDVRRCQERLPRERAAILNSRYLLNVPAGRDMRSYGINVSPYDFQRHRFELTVYGISSTETCPTGEISEGPRSPDLPPERPRRVDCTYGGVATSLRRDATSSPLLRFYVNIDDLDQAERWREENAGHYDLVMAVVFRVGQEGWRERILDGRGAILMMHPIALQVRNARSDAVIFETTFGSSSNANGAPPAAPSGQSQVEAASSAGPPAITSGPSPAEGTPPSAVPATPSVRLPEEATSPSISPSVATWTPPLNRPTIGNLDALRSDVEAALTSAGANCRALRPPSIVPPDTVVFECNNLRPSFLAPTGQTSCILFFRSNRLASLVIPLGNEATPRAALTRYRRDLREWPARFGVPGGEPRGHRTPMMSRFQVSPDVVVRIGMTDSRAGGAGFVRLLTIESLAFVNAQGRGPGAP